MMYVLAKFPQVSVLIFISIYGQNSVKILKNPYNTWRHW